MALTYAAAAPHPALRATFSPLDGEKVAKGRMRGVESLS